MLNYWEKYKRIKKSCKSFKVHNFFQGGHCFACLER